MTTPAHTHRDVCIYEAPHTVVAYSVGMLLAPPGACVEESLQRWQTLR